MSSLKHSPFTVVETPHGVAYQREGKTIATITKDGTLRVSASITGMLYRLVFMDAEKYRNTGLFRVSGQQRTFIVEAM